MTDKPRYRPMTEKDVPGAPETAGPEPQAITDPKSMRAMAHPVRLALIELIAREGELTASRAAELLDDSPGNMSWHLQTLAKYGYIEEAGSGRGRVRPWRLVTHTQRFSSAAGGAEEMAAGDALEATLMGVVVERLKEWRTERRDYTQEWREAAFSTISLSYLTPDELDEVQKGINALLAQYIGRLEDKSTRPPGARPVEVVAFGHPVPQTPSGN